MVQSVPQQVQVARWVGDLRHLDEHVQVIFELAEAHIIALPAIESEPTLLPDAPEMLSNIARQSPWSPIGTMGFVRALFESIAVASESRAGQHSIRSTALPGSLFC